MSHLLMDEISKSKHYVTKITHDPYDFQPIIWSTFETWGEDLTERPILKLTDEKRDSVFKRDQTTLQRIQYIQEPR